MKIFSIYASLFIIGFLSACSPIEDRESIGSPITAEQLNVTATPIVINGKNSNKIVLINNSPVLSEWNYNIGKSNRQSDTILWVLTGTTDILFTGLNPDGSLVIKSLSVHVDELSFDVPKEWAYLCGRGEKEWIWDSNQEVWGTGSYLNDDKPTQWKLAEKDIEEQAKGEGVGASMIFSVKGVSLSKKKSDGTIVKGTFSFDMSKTKTKEDGTLWSKGTLKTIGTSVLCGISPNEDGKTITDFDILYLDDKQLILGYPESGVVSGGTAWYWVFRSK